MSKAEIEAHLAKFDDGAVRFTSKSGISKHGTYGPDGGFVIPKSEFERVMLESKGDLRIVEQKLGLDKGYLSNSDTVVVVIEKNNISGLRMPSGNESGANKFWKPGGYTSGGVVEAVMDFSHKPQGTILNLNKINEQLLRKSK